MQLYYIRHAQSMNNVRWDQTKTSEGREADPELTELGREQLTYLADHLKTADPRQNTRERLEPRGTGFGITHLYCSLMIRAVETGLAVSRALNLPLVAWPELHERGGLWNYDEEGNRQGIEGPGRDYFEERYPALVLPEGLGDAGWWSRPAELWEDVPARAERVLAQLRENHGDDDRVALISHGGLYNSLLRVLLKMETNEGYWLELNNAGVSRIDLYDGKVDLMYSNWNAHLPPALLT